MLYPEKPRPGDLEERYEVRAVEFPTTRKLGSSPRERADDVHAAFADPDIKAVLTSIGGEDQVKVLRHLDPELLRANPKPFFGISDNTNLHHFLFGLGIVSYYGGTVMTMLGRGGAMNPHAEESFAAAFLGADWYDLRPADSFTDLDRDWADPVHLETEPEMLRGADVPG